jgi:hypothetical protein
MNGPYITRFLFGVHNLVRFTIRWYDNCLLLFASNSDSSTSFGFDHSSLLAWPTHRLMVWHYTAPGNPKQLLTSAAYGVVRRQSYDGVCVLPIRLSNFNFTDQYVLADDGTLQRAQLDE